MTKFPSQAEISKAIEVAARLAGVDPESFKDAPRPGGGKNPTARARWVAFGALFTLYPGALAPALARAVHIKSANVARAKYADCSNRTTWPAHWVEEVVAAIRPGWAAARTLAAEEPAALPPAARNYETVSRRGVSLPRLRCLEVAP